jgi:thiol-disulfide isomerase/thioredoxin
MTRLLFPFLIACAWLLAACTPSADAPAAQDAAPPDAEPAPATEPVPLPGDDEGKPETPGLRIATLDGDEYDLAERRGKWVVVNFWATWCSPCLKEMPELSALDAMREHIEVIGLAYEEIEPAAMRAFLEKHPVVYPIAILDVYDPPADFATPRGLPMTYLIAPDGKVARQFLGPVTAQEIETAIANNGGPPVEA